MCGRFAMPWDPEQVAGRSGIGADESAGEVAPSYNVAPGSTIAVVRRTADDRSLRRSKERCLPDDGVKTIGLPFFGTAE